MNKDYAQLYIDGMRKAGYDEGDNARLKYASFFKDCLDDVNYKEITSKAGFDHELFCAAVAQLKTSQCWGCSNHGPYNIQEFFCLTKEQTDFIISNVSSNLAGLAKGAILDSEQTMLWKYVFITFYGDWIGKPCDNYYCVNSIEESDHQITISLDDMVIVVDNPVNTQKTAKEYSVAHAGKITISNGSSILRVYEKTSEGVKRTDDGQSEIIEIKEPYYALCITRYS